MVALGNWAAVVVACAVAVVATAGGAAYAMLAVASAANGMAAATTASTIAAGAFIGSSMAFGGTAMIAASNSKSISGFYAQGNWGTVVTVALGGALGALQGYLIDRSTRSSGRNILSNKNYTNSISFN